MVNYRLGKIYSIRSRAHPEAIYIGSTCSTLTKRFSDHNSQYKSWQNGKHHKISAFEILAYGDAYIELVENYPCLDKNELHRREGQIIRSMNCVNNKVPGRTPKQHYQDNKMRLNANTRQYYHANKAEIKVRSLQWRRANKERINANMKQYNQDNRARINAKKQERLMCGHCDILFTRGNKSSHIRSKNHIINYKRDWRECFGEPFDGVITTQDY